MQTKEKESFKVKNMREWEHAISALFPLGQPTRVIWSDPNNIVRALNTIGKLNLNHTFFPDSGGLDLTGAAFAPERGCIELHFDGFTSIVRIKQLMFESFPGSDIQWSYFRLELDELLPSGVYEQSSEYNSEQVTEITPGHYVTADASEYNEYNGEKLPEGARSVVRYFKGSLVIFCKSSFYNVNNYFDAYDARHNKVDADTFRNELDNVRSRVK